MGTTPDRRTPRHETGQALADVAAGRRPASLVVRNCRWVSVHTGEIIPDTDIAVLGARIAYVGPDAGFAIEKSKTEVVDAAGRYVLPGLCDAHMHVESGMVTVTEFCRAVIPHGTTTMFVDPHEVANVLGLKGVKAMLDEALAQPIGVHVQMPSCVPSAPGLEDSGAAIGPEEVAEAMGWDGIVGLGEMMSFPQVAAGDDFVHQIIASTQRAGKTVGGHFPAPSDGNDFHAYVASGPEDDHEVTSLAGAIDRARRGMRTMLRHGSAWLDIDETVRAITEQRLDSRYFILCTDDSHSGTLVNEGHMNRAVRYAISRGLAPVTAIQMATLNAAEHFGMARDIGSVAPGRLADFIVTSDLVDLPVEMVYAGGRLLAADGVLTVDIPAYRYPDFAYGTVKVERELAPADFQIATEADGEVNANVIGVIENQAPTRALERTVAAAGGKIQPDRERDIAQIAVVERHSGAGQVALALVEGFGFDCDCAVASTVMHDSHNMIVVGTDPASMASAANALREKDGGVVVWREGEAIALVELPVAGLMSDKRAEEVAAEATGMVEAMARCGCRLNNAFMQLSLLGLVVIPDLRISNRGLVDVRTGSTISLLAD